MRNNPKPYEIYEHFKGNKYQVITLAKHSETGEEMVVYQALYGDYAMYVRPLSLFLGMVDGEKYPEQKGEYRFRNINKEAASGEEKISNASFNVSEAMADEDITKKEEKQENPSENVPKQEPEASMEEGFVDPMVMDFLDADTYEERLNILAALHHRITDDMINTMAIAVDVEIEDGPIETRYEELKHCLITFQKYQCSRMC